MSKYCAGSFTYSDPFTEEAAFIEVNARSRVVLQRLSQLVSTSLGWCINWLRRVDLTHFVTHASAPKRSGYWGDVITVVGRLVKLKFNCAELRQAMKFSGFDAFDDFRKEDKRAILGEMGYYLGKLVKNGKLNP